MKTQRAKKTNEKKNHLKKRSYVKALFVVLGILVVLGVLGFVSRGWIRTSVEPKFVEKTYGHTLEKVANNELKKLGDPFNALGYATTTVEGPTCRLATAHKFSTALSCTYTIKAYQETPQADADKKASNEAAIKTQQLLKSNGWDGEYGTKSPYTSLAELVSNINKGIDYTPDAAYTKVIGDVSCLLDSNTAFSSPKAPAIASNMYCSRDVYLFGQPTGDNVLYPMPL